MPSSVQPCPRPQNEKEEQSSHSVICETGPFFSHFSRWTHSLSHTSTFKSPCPSCTSCQSFSSSPVFPSLPWRFLRFLHTLPSKSLDIWSAPIKLTRLLSKMFTRLLPTVNFSIIFIFYYVHLASSLPTRCAVPCQLAIWRPVYFICRLVTRTRAKKKEWLTKFSQYRNARDIGDSGGGWMWVASRSDVQPTHLAGRSSGPKA